MKIRLDHINILVEDWDKTVEFYQQLFGFIEGKNIPNGQKNYLYTADGAHALIHLSTLAGKARNLANLEIPFQVQATPGSENQNTGALDHIALAVRAIDFESILKKLELLKIPYRMSRKEPQQIWFFDPNRVKLEISLLEKSA